MYNKDFPKINFSKFFQENIAPDNKSLFQKLNTKDFSPNNKENIIDNKIFLNNENKCIDNNIFPFFKKENNINKTINNSPTNIFSKPDEKNCNPFEKKIQLFYNSNIVNSNFSFKDKEIKFFNDQEIINNNIFNHDNNKNNNNNEFNKKDILYNFPSSLNEDNNKKNSLNDVENSRIFIENFKYENDNNNFKQEVKMNLNWIIDNDKDNNERLEINNLVNINRNKDKDNNLINEIQQFKFSECKELEENEKLQLLQKTNGEIIEDFKNMLKQQKEIFKQCTENIRQIENKYYIIMKKKNENENIYEINVNKKLDLIEKLNLINEYSNNLKALVEKENNAIDYTLSNYKNNILKNNYNLLYDSINDDKFQLYDDLIKTSKKCTKIENDIKYIENKMSEKEKNIFNNDENGIMIERLTGKINIDQNKMNSLLSDCYEGLKNLKEMEDIFDFQFKLLKQNLLKYNKNNI